MKTIPSNIHNIHITSNIIYIYEYTKNVLEIYIYIDIDIDIIYTQLHKYRTIIPKNPYHTPPIHRFFDKRRRKGHVFVRPNGPCSFNLAKARRVKEPPPRSWWIWLCFHGGKDGKIMGKSWMGKYHRKIHGKIMNICNILVQVSYIFEREKMGEIWNHHEWPMRQWGHRCSDHGTMTKAFCWRRHSDSCLQLFHGFSSHIKGLLGLRRSTDSSYIGE